MDSGVVAGYHVEAVGRRDRLALVGLDDDLAPPVHRRVADREDRRRDQGGVVDEKDPAFPHCPDQRPVDELVRAVGALGVLADEVAHRGVAVAGDGDQVREGRLDQAGLARAGRPGQQRGDALGAQRAQRLDIGHARQHARAVDLPSRAGDGAGRALRGGSLRRGGRRWRGWRSRRLRCRRRGGWPRPGRRGWSGRCRPRRPTGRGLWRSRRPCAGRGGRRATRQPGGEAGRCRGGPSGPGRK